MPALIEWDTSLIRRYDQAGPRYTSYPTETQFHEGVGVSELLAALDESRQARRPLSLYVHIPFCAHICYYCACNKVITKDRGRSLPYLERLEKEIEIISRHTGPQQRVEQLHLGGGTPTFLSHSELRRLMECLRRHFKLAPGGDFSIEIDPREADWSTMGLLRELGFNHISLGVQDLDPEVERAVNRLQSLEETRAIVEAARTLEFRSVNIDLIYGLPKQTSESFARTVEEIIALQPDRLSIYNYVHLPERFKPQRRINATDLPSPAEKLSILHNSIEQVTAAGYQYVGMGHFALPDDELAIAQEEGRLEHNFQGYTPHGHCDLIGLGASAISQIGDLYSQNANDIEAYQNSLDEGRLPATRGLRCNEDDRIRRTVIQQLICDFHLDFTSIEKQFDIVFREYFSATWPQLQSMARDKLINLTSKGIDVLPAGRLLVRSVCTLFDHYLELQNGQRLSRII